MRTRFFYPTGAEIDQGFFDMCLKRWPLKAEDLIASSVIDHPDVITTEITGYLRLIDDAGNPAQVATEASVDRKDSGQRTYTIRTLILRQTLEMSVGGEIWTATKWTRGTATAGLAAQTAMALKVGLSAITRTMNDCARIVSGFPGLAQEIEDAYPIHAARYDFVTEWDLLDHKKGLGLLARRRIDPRLLDDVLIAIDGLRHAWELAEFEAGGQKLGEMYFKRAGRWTGRMDLTPGSIGRAHAERFVAEYGRKHESQGDAAQK